MSEGTRQVAVPVRFLHYGLIIEEGVVGASLLRCDRLSEAVLGLRAEWSERLLSDHISLGERGLRVRVSSA